MTDAPHAGEGDWQRRRDLARIFGEVLPETTSDEQDDEQPESPSESAGDRWLREQVPPHHG